MYSDAPPGSNYLLAGNGWPEGSIFGPTFPFPSLSTPIGGAWVQWDATAAGTVSLELPYGPFAFSGQPNFAPGVSQGSAGNDKQDVTMQGQDYGESGFYVAVTQTSGGTRTVEGYVWINAFALLPVANFQRLP